MDGLSDQPEIVFAVEAHEPNGIWRDASISPVDDDLRWVALGFFDV